MASELSPKEYEDTIRRLKLLSKSQTAFLKKYLNEKLQKAKIVFTNTLNSVPQDQLVDKIDDLKSAIEFLQIDLFAVSEFDDMPFQQEIRLLRESLDDKKSTAQAPSNGDSQAHQSELKLLKDKLDKSESQVKKNEVEVVRLKDKLSMAETSLKRSETEISTLKGQNSSKATSSNEEVTSLKAAITNIQIDLDQKTSELTKKSDETLALTLSIAELKSQIEKKDSELKTKDGEIAHLSNLANKADMNQALQQEIDRLKAEKVQLDTDYLTLKTEQSSQLAAKDKQLTDMNAKAADLQRQVDKEKEEMMEVAAQEVEVGVTSYLPPSLLYINMLMHIYLHILLLNANLGS